MEKKIFYLMLVMVMGIVFFVSCSDDDNEPSKLAVSTSKIEKGFEGGSAEVDVTSNTKWVVTGANDWCSVSNKEGVGNGFFEVVISPSTLTTERTNVLKIRTSDGTVVEEISVTQAAVDQLEANNPGEFNYGKDDKKILQIYSNLNWNISGIPDWLDCSQRSGKGDCSVELRTKSENNSSQERTATLTISGKTKTVTVEVVQKSKLSKCTAKPKNIVTLSQSVAMQIECTSDVKNYKMLIWDANRVDAYSDEEIKQELRTAYSRTPDNRPIITDVDLLTPGTKYVQMTLAYDKNDVEGELIKTPFETKSNEQQSIVAINDIAFYTNLTAQWMAVPNEYTEKYYSMFLSGMSYNQILSLCDDEGYFKYPLLAWIMEMEIKKGSNAIQTLKGLALVTEKKGYIIENYALKDNGNAANYGYFLVVTRGENVRGGYSGKLEMEYGNLGDSKSGKKNVRRYKGKLPIDPKVKVERAYIKY